MKEFKHEEHYIVVKISDIDEALFPGEKKTLEELISKVKQANPDYHRYIVINDSDEETFDYVSGMVEADWLKCNGQYNKAIFKRAESECSLISSKIDKLHTYINSVHFNKLNPGTQQRLTVQLSHMEDYRQTLYNRIIGDLRLLVEGVPISFEPNTGNGQAPAK